MLAAHALGNVYSWVMGELKKKQISFARTQNYHEPQRMLAAGTERMQIGISNLYYL